MRTSLRLLQLVLLFLFQGAFAQITLETVYVSRKKPVKPPVEIRYYYYPNLEVYYDICNSQYILRKDGKWITSDNLSASYRGYCLYNKFYVILEGFTEDEPYLLLDQHKKKYPTNYSSKRRKDIAIAQN